MEGVSKRTQKITENYSPYTGLERAFKSEDKTFNCEKKGECEVNG